MKKKRRAWQGGRKRRKYRDLMLMPLDTRNYYIEVGGLKLKHTFTRREAEFKAAGFFLAYDKKVSVRIGPERKEL